MHFDLCLLTKNAGEWEWELGRRLLQETVTAKITSLQIPLDFWSVGKPLSKAEAISNMLTGTEIQNEKYWDSNLWIQNTECLGNSGPG